MDVQPRHELKHEISHGDYLALRRRIAAVAARDPHVGSDGCYRIHSLYFDNADDKALREKLDGVSAREKFRIRYYNEDISRITLEKKCKERDLGIKYAAPVTAEQVRALLAGETAWMADSPHGLVRELYAKMKTEALRPRTTVDYLREPFLYPAGNVRVTFDSRISAGAADAQFLEPHAAIPAAPSGTVVLEVKYDCFLPELIAGVLQLGDCRQTAFSKYAACRLIY